METVLVTCATGKAGFGVCQALVDAGYDVYGTTRSTANAKKLAGIGVTPVMRNYTHEVSGRD